MKIMKLLKGEVRNEMGYLIMKRLALTQKLRTCISFLIQIPFISFMSSLLYYYYYDTLYMAYLLIPIARNTPISFPCSWMSITVKNNKQK